MELESLNKFEQSYYNLINKRLYYITIYRPIQLYYILSLSYPLLFTNCKNSLHRILLISSFACLLSGTRTARRGKSFAYNLVKVGYKLKVEAKFRACNARRRWQLMANDIMLPTGFTPQLYSGVELMKVARDTITTELWIKCR